MELYVVMALLTLLALVTVAIILQRGLFAVVILSGVYSFLMATAMVALDAVDVAMTEAAVGAGVSTVVLLSTLYLTESRAYPQPRIWLMPLLLSVGVGAAMIYGTLTLPPFGAEHTPLHDHVGGDYLDKSIPETGVANVVSAVLADYRSFDTLGETTVVFTAAIGVLMLLRGGGGRRPVKKPGKD